MNKKIFISHSQKDKNIAEIICSTLESENIGCWIAPRDIPYGNDWAGEITSAIENSELFIFILSENSNISRQCPKEISIADNSNKPIICIKIDNVEMNQGFKYHLSMQQTFFLDTSILDDKLISIVEIVKEKLNNKTAKCNYVNTNNIDDLFRKIIEDRNDKLNITESNASTNVVKKLLQRKEQQTQKAYCSWIDSWNNDIEIIQHTSCIGFDIPKHSLCDNIVTGCHFTEVEKENIETIVYEIYKSFSVKTRKKYYYLKKLDSSKKLKNNKKFKTYYIDDPQDDGNQLIFLHFDKENNQVLINNGILLPNGKNGHIVKITTDPSILPLSNTSPKIISKKDFSFDNLTEEQKNSFLNGTTDMYFYVDIDSSTITIDTETYEPVPKEIVFENDRYKARIKLNSSKNYCSFQLYSADTNLTDFQLAECYYYGVGDFPEDTMKAAEIFEKIGDGKSLRYLAHMWLHESEFTTDDLNEAVFYLEEADRFGNHLAGCELIYYIMKSFYFNTIEKKPELTDKLYSQISKMTEENSSIAMFLAGYIYEKGMATEKDIDKSFNYYYLAASLGEKTAKIRLGIDSVQDEFDENKCKIDFQNSQQDVGFSDYCMGRFLYDTKGFWVNISDIIHFYETAANAGNQYAIKELAEVYTIGSNSLSIEPNPAKAIMLYEKLTDAYDIDSDWGVILANYYLDGKGCEICEDNDKKAFELLSFLLSEYTDGVVMNNLGWMYKNGRGCTTDYAQANALFEKAAKLDCISSYYHLGIMYENGLGTEINIDLAKKMYKIAAEKGHQKSIKRLKNIQ